MVKRMARKNQKSFSPARPKQQQRNLASLTIQLKFKGDLLTEQNMGPRAAYFIIKSNPIRLQFSPGLSHSWKLKVDLLQHPRGLEEFMSLPQGQEWTGATWVHINILSKRKARCTVVSAGLE